MVRVSPNSSRNAIAFDLADRLTVKLTSPPVEGQANKDLIKFLARRLGIPSSAMRIISGLRSRVKTILVHGMNVASVRRSLETK